MTNLLQIKHVVVEELVQLLVCEVDAQLLKAVDGKVLKPENVQHANKLGRVRAWVGCAVDLVPQPRKCSRVQRLGLVRLRGGGKGDRKCVWVWV